MKKAYILIGTALAALLVLVSCSESGENEIDASSSFSASTSSSTALYSEEYLNTVSETLTDNMEQLGIVIIGIDIANNKVSVGMLDTSDDILAKVENIIGKEAMDACDFFQTIYPETT
mgnify:CR=1 FL=1